MADGEWKITQYAPAAKTGVKVTTVGAVRGGQATNGLVFHHPDGRQEIYPWPSIVKAEYTPRPDTHI